MSIFFLLLSLPSSVLQWNHEGNFFLKFDQSNWNFYVEYYLELSSPLLEVQELLHKLLSLTILCTPLSSSTTFQSSSNTSAPIFLVSRFPKQFIPELFVLLPCQESYFYIKSTFDHDNYHLDFSCAIKSLVNTLPRYLK